MVDRATVSLSGALTRFAELDPTVQRRWVAAMDACLCLLATWIAFALRLGLVYLPLKPFAIVLALAILCWAVVARHLGFYRMMLRFSGGQTMFDLVWAAVLMIVMMSALILALRVDSLPRTMAVLQPMTFVGLVGMSRLGLRFLLVDFVHRAAGRVERAVVIYGAGRAGQQLALSLRHEPHIRVLGYFDDDWRLHGQRIDGRPIHDPARLSAVVHGDHVDEVLIALPSATRERRREIVEALQPHGVSVRALPSTAEIIAGEVTLSDLREVEIEDLLGRDPVPPNELLLGRNVAGKTVLVTGAGGSIGSELCRQILRSHPRRLVLVEHSEFALYTITDELSADPALGDCVLASELCNVCDANAVRRIFARQRPDTVFHSAAYKHVPLVEANPIAGVCNNVFGTLNACLAAEAAGVSSFILISTDKAVRPTNVMGASKRVCELVLQARAGVGGKTTFAMVRFGNVLGSSGSVIPRFKAQIAAGGPVTLTDREVTRYFMTIPEAAQLVIQAGAMADGGDVFVLDMGEPVKIYDLARTLIRLSRRSVRDESNPMGEIEIVEIGLRNGEKKYEELLIGSDPLPTLHPRIIKAHEDSLPWAELEDKLNQMRAAAAAGDGEGVVAILRDLVPGFERAIHSRELPAAG
ncbi:polysaccharide biosynthesis protein [Tsuneonella sp. HG222]